MKRNLVLLSVLSAATVVPAAFAFTPSAQAPSAITIAASPGEVVYESTATLSGAITPAAAGERVRIDAQACGAASFTQLQEVQTAANGAWSLTVRPTVTTQYRARVRGQTSSIATVGVRPRISLAKVGTRRFRVQVFAAQSFAGKRITFQRYRASTRTWVRVRGATLRQLASTPQPPTVVSGVTFRSRVRTRLRVRVVLARSQAAPCYLPGRSNVIRS